MLNYTKKISSIIYYVNLWQVRQLYYTSHFLLFYTDDNQNTYKSI